ncbi:MAG TPA: TRAP transporter TatT component family protein [Vicinamibacteria bacterium]|nr:TRAP transporter TatT component family protein [Vicinamibacteria bacterium]
MIAASVGCSIRKYAINQIGDVLASGGSIYESDEDIEFVGDALPFSLKLVESLIEESPEHRGLLLGAANGFCVYSYVYVHFDAEVMANESLERARALRERARRFYLRAHRYGLRGLDLLYPGFSTTLPRDPEAAVSMVETGKAKDVLPYLYWSAASLGLAISVAKNDASMLARIPEVEALLGRAMELDETYEEGALHEFQITLAGAKPGRIDVDAVRAHYERALELSSGKRASLHLAYAETVSVPAQNANEFRELVNVALAVDPDAYPSLRLANLVARRRAEWLLEQIEVLFLEPDGDSL